MAGPAEVLFAELHDSAAVLALIGEAEDAHLDCKEWPNGEESQKMIAKAVCGLSNADGGVLVIGMKAASSRNDEPDVVTSSAPVENTSLVKSKVLDLVGKLVEAGIAAVEVREVALTANSTSGFVVIYIPRNEGSPTRSRKDWKFYQRIGSTTLPMDYWQIEAMFGKPPIPQLSLQFEVFDMVEYSGSISHPLRHMQFGLKNEGRGVAKFPGIRFKAAPRIAKDPFGIDGNSNFGLPYRASEPDWIVFRGGVDDVIYPDETRWIGKLSQSAVSQGKKGVAPPGGQPVMRFQFAEEEWVCENIILEVEISTEGMRTQRLVHPVGAASMTLTSKIGLPH